MFLPDSGVSFDLAAKRMPPLPSRKCSLGSLDLTPLRREPLGGGGGGGGSGSGNTDIRRSPSGGSVSGRGTRSGSSAIPMSSGSVSPIDPSSSSRRRSFSTTATMSTSLKERRRVTLNFIMDDAEFSTHFLQYLTNKNRAESFFFFRSVLGHEKIDDTAQCRANANALCEQFLKPGAPMELSSVKFAKRRVVIDACKTNDGLDDPRTFHHILRHTRLTLENDSSVRFLSSDYYTRRVPSTAKERLRCALDRLSDKSPPHSAQSPSSSPPLTATPSSSSSSSTSSSLPSLLLSHDAHPSMSPRNKAPRSARRSLFFSSADNTPTMASDLTNMYRDTIGNDSKRTAPMSPGINSKARGRRSSTGSVVGDDFVPVCLQSTTITTSPFSGLARDSGPHALGEGRSGGVGGRRLSARFPSNVLHEQQANTGNMGRLADVPCEGTAPQGLLAAVGGPRSASPPTRHTQYSRHSKSAGKAYRLQLAAGIASSSTSSSAASSCSASPSSSPSSSPPVDSLSSSSGSIDTSSPLFSGRAVQLPGSSFAVLARRNDDIIHHEPSPPAPQYRQPASPLLSTRTWAPSMSLTLSDDDIKSPSSPSSRSPHYNNGGSSGGGSAGGGGGSGGRSRDYHIDGVGDVEGLSSNAHDQHKRSDDDDDCISSSRSLEDSRKDSNRTINAIKWKNRPRVSSAKAKSKSSPSSVKCSPTMKGSTLFDLSSAMTVLGGTFRSGGGSGSSSSHQHHHLGGSGVGGIKVRLRRSSSGGSRALTARPSHVHHENFESDDDNANTNRDDHLQRGAKGRCSSDNPAHMSRSDFPIQPTKLSSSTGGTHTTPLPGKILRQSLSPSLPARSDPSSSSSSPSSSPSKAWSYALHQHPHRRGRSQNDEMALAQQLTASSRELEIQQQQQQRNALPSQYSGKNLSLQSIPYDSSPTSSLSPALLPAQSVSLSSTTSSSHSGSDTSASPLSAPLSSNKKISRKQVREFKKAAKKEEIRRQVKKAILEAKVLPAFVQVISEPNVVVALMEAFCAPSIEPEVAERLFDAVCKLFSRCNVIPHLLHLTFRIALEGKNQASTNTLLREESVATKLMAAYLSSSCQKYLNQTVGPLVRRLAHLDHDLECDPKRAKEGTDIEGNARLLLEIVEKFYAGVLSSAQRLPNEVRQVLNLLQSEAQRLTGGTALQAVGNVLFLRFICPAIVGPEKVRIVAADVIQPHHRRTLIVISKLMQKLVNNTTFDAHKEPHLIPLNKFISGANRSKLINFYMEAMDFTDEPPQPIHTNLPRAELEHVNTHLSIILAGLVENMGKVMPAMMTCVGIEQHLGNLISYALESIDFSTGSFPQSSSSSSKSSSSSSATSSSSSSSSGGAHQLPTTSVFFLADETVWAKWTQHGHSDSATYFYNHTESLSSPSLRAGSTTADVSPILPPSSPALSALTHVVSSYEIGDPSPSSSSSSSSPSSSSSSSLSLPPSTSSSPSSAAATPPHCPFSTTPLRSSSSSPSISLFAFESSALSTSSSSPVTPFHLVQTESSSPDVSCPIHNQQR